MWREDKLASLGLDPLPPALFTAELARLCPQPCQGDRGMRLLRRFQGKLPHPPCIRDHATGNTTNPSRQGLLEGTRQGSGGPRSESPTNTGTGEKANSVCEHFGGTLRRKCLELVILMGKRHLKRTMADWKVSSQPSQIGKTHRGAANSRGASSSRSHPDGY